MYKDRRIAVVVPAYNEARHVGGVLAGVPPYVDHVIAVDDCSTDETASVLASIEDSRLVCLRTAENQGVGGATMLAVRIDLTKIIATPQNVRKPTPHPTAALWRLRVEGSVGKGTAKQTWKSSNNRHEESSD